MSTIRVSFCLNAGAKAGQPLATVVARDSATEALLQAASNKLRLKKKDAAAARLFVWSKDGRGGTELPRGGSAAALLRNDDLLAVSVGEAYSGPRPAQPAAAAADAAAPATRREPPPLISGSDDAGRSYASLETLWTEQARHHREYYAANERWWDEDGYGGGSDEEAMIGDGGSEEDIEHSLRLLDALKARRPALAFGSALDGGSGVGRVTKHVLLRRFERVCLVEPCARWLKQSRRYLGNKRAGKCAFVHARLEELEAPSARPAAAAAAAQLFDLVWVQWTLQYLVDAHVVAALRSLASRLSAGGRARPREEPASLVKRPVSSRCLATALLGVLVVKENKPCAAGGGGGGAAPGLAFRVDTPSGPHGRYDVTRPDEHHEWLFACAGLEVEHAESGCVGGEVTAWVLVRRAGGGAGRTPNEWRRPHRAGDGEEEAERELVRPTLDVEAMARAAEERAQAEAREAGEAGEAREAREGGGAPPSLAEMRAAAVRAGSLVGVVPVSGCRLSADLTAAYLDRLRLSAAEVSEPTLQSLCRLQAAHISLVAYENLDLHAGGGGAPLPPPRLDPVASAERVALRRRGGYCFVLVDAFAALLTSLGFVVSLHTAGVGESPLAAEKWGNHIVLLVHLGERRFVSDVGLGDGPLRPFELREHAWEEDGYAFRLEATGASTWHFTHHPLGSFRGFDFCLSSSAASAREFGEYHAFYWSHPDSPYRVSGPVLQRVTPERGVLTLRCCTLRRVHPGLPAGSTTIAVAASADEWLALVREHFCMPLIDSPPEQQTSLWLSAKTKHDAWLAQERGREAP